MIFGRNQEKNQSPDSGQKAEPSIVGQVLRYSHLPGIIPRIRELALKFGHFAYMLALVFRAVNLLPANHPYTNPANIGRYGLRDTIAAAANNVKFNRDNVDQIAVFGAVVMSVFLLASQFIVIGVSVVMGRAQAADSFFELNSVSPENDVVLKFLEQVFGSAAGVFGTSVAGADTPIHEGMQAMLSFYSMAMLVLAVFIILYYIVTVVGEAAISGTPFGRRFNSLWAPIRLVVALGLLVPIANGLNSAQYITLYTAKMGSNLASNAWSLFVAEAEDSEASRFVMKPETGQLSQIVQATFIGEVCSQAFNQINGGDSSKAYIAYEAQERIEYGCNSAGNCRSAFRPIVVAQEMPASGTTNAENFYNTARAANANSIRFFWTHEDPNQTSKAQCGDMSMEIAPIIVTDPDNPDASHEAPSSAAVHIAYIDAVLQAREDMQAQAARIVGAYIDINASGDTASRALSAADRTDIRTQLSNTFTTITNSVNAVLDSAFTNYPGEIETHLFSGMAESGWGGAALYYSRIGQVNQKFAGLAANVPTASAMFSGHGNANERFWGAGADRTWVARTFTWDAVQTQLDTAGSNALDIVEEFNFSATGARYENAGQGSGPLDTLLNIIFGVDDIFMFKNVSSMNLDPTAGLMAIGDNMVQRSIYALFIAVGLNVASGVLSGIPLRSPITSAVTETLAAIFEKAAAFAYLVVLIGLGAGLMLFYLLPLMPFIYFFFAIVSWLMEIFEAIVAMPLWALAHLKIDGDGLPGPMAVNGYYLLLGILLRPVLIVFGLIGGYIIFGAGAYLLASIFDIVVDEVTGGRDIGALGKLVYVIIFVYLIYNIGMICFKMVDSVPRGILRWIGQGGATPFSDEKPEDPFQGSKGMIFAAAGVASLHRPGSGRGMFRDAQGKKIFESTQTGKGGSDSQS